ncbi:1-acyl-sn-glycerol-3-phosphate acyltransferase [Flavobacteriaceae bacterium]|jgi:1-acyl-sn-glycerol-3-phosphate acyltransferase|nr:1-acyl-sn-glycerol-3-phosphate acyltransferase [Flavobacteriaceae bacterium]MDG1889040.1 1-acyl-sn-glycerol-3-phosphate acyltransferase [Flavobacteriaceae bacterium]|tara:strand:- start:316 stop:849 length:534 start_codon:yes stop_codon:yes gene_type:complete
MIKILSKFILSKIIGWKVIGSLPVNKKYIIAVVPHSSYFDLIVAVLIRTYSGVKIKFIGKKELFNPVTAFFFRFLGGIPVNRNKNTNLVDAVVNLFHTNKIQILAIAPEGTRKKVNKWKTGFYYIALKAELPILMVSFDYDRKEVKINDKFNPTGNIESDFNVLENMVSDVVFRNKI